MTVVDRLRRAAVGYYFEASYRLLAGSSDGRRFLEYTAPLAGMPAHGYTTADDVDALIRALEPGRTGALLDLGCGVGGVALEVNRRTDATITGVDLSARAIESATARSASASADPRVRFVLGSIRRPPSVGATGAYAGFVDVPAGGPRRPARDP